MKILFLINGLGLGNSTRCHKLIDVLSKEHNIFIGTSGNGYSYLKQFYPNIIQLKQLQYQNDNGDLNILKTFSISSIINHIKTILNNQKIITELVKKEKIELIIQDSFYYFTRINNIGLNNSKFVLENSGLIKGNKSLYSSFYLVETLDFLYHKFFVKKIIVPDFHKKTDGKFFHINGFSRDVEKKETKINIKPKILIMLSGSNFDKKIEISNKLVNDFDITLLGLSENDVICAQKNKLNILGKVLNNKEIINNTDYVIINAGSSAIFEMICLRKPMLVLPIKNHAEQYINAKTVENLGYGYMINHSSMVEDKIYSLEKHKEVLIENMSLSHEIISDKEILDLFKFDKYFEKISNEYDKKINLIKFIRDKEKNDFLEYLSKNNIENKKTLELGCGNGYYTKEINKYIEEKNLTIVDSSIGMLNKVNVNCKKICEDVNKLSLTEKYKNIFIIGMMEFLSIEEQKELLTKLKGNLDTNGKIILVLPYKSIYSKVYYLYHKLFSRIKINIMSKKELTKIGDIKKDIGKINCLMEIKNE